jgi:hypothetical protein
MPWRSRPPMIALAMLPPPMKAIAAVEEVSGLLAMTRV